MIHQDDPEMSSDFQHIGCLFSDEALSCEVLQGKVWTHDTLQAAWDLAVAKKVISPDANHDGDLLDAGEGVILSHNALFALLGWPLIELTREEFACFPHVIDHDGVMRIAPMSAPVDPKKFWTIEAWYRKENKFLHFVKGSGTGLCRPEYDPILNGGKGSNTRRYGKIESLRIFKIAI